jgi:hypothetical protein
MASNANGGTFTASNYNISYVNGLMTVNPVTPPPPPQTSVNNLDGLSNPVLVGLQSLGIGVPPITEESSDCLGEGRNFGATVDNGVAVSVPQRCATKISD